MVFVGDDWAKDHHDVELVDEAGRRLARARLPEGMDGVSRLHALIAEHAPPEWADLDPDEVAARVRVGIETDRGPWVQALAAARGNCVIVHSRESRAEPGRPLHIPNPAGVEPKEVRTGARRQAPRQPQTRPEWAKRSY